MADDLRTRLIDEMKAVFGDDRRRIDHALHVLGFAERILADGDADTTVVIAAAILHDIGIHAAQVKHGSSAGRYQEIEGPPIARAILENHGADAAMIEGVCAIIAHHHNGRMNTPEFNVIWDADWLVNLPEAYPNADRDTLAAAIAKTLRTATGRAIAMRLFLADG